MAVKGVSFGSYCKVQAGNRYDIDYYGPTDSPSVINSHFLKHLQNLHNISQNHTVDAYIITSFLKKESPGSKHLVQLEEFAYRRLGLSLTEAWDDELHMMEQNLYSI